MSQQKSNYTYSQLREDFKDTLFSNEWLDKYHGVLRSFFPEIWTDIPELKIHYIEYGLNSLGIHWKNLNQFIQIMVHLENCKIIDRSNMMIKRSLMPLDTTKLR